MFTVGEATVDPLASIFFAEVRRLQAVGQRLLELVGHGLGQVGRAHERKPHADVHVLVLRRLGQRGMSGVVAERLASVVPAQSPCRS